jgi:hypothetical protein
VECFCYGEGSFVGILDGHVCNLFKCNPNFEYQFDSILIQSAMNSSTYRTLDVVHVLRLL